MGDAAKWKYALNNALLQGCVGTVAGALAAAVLFRRTTPRVAAAAFGGGAGLGRAYVDLRYVFGHEVRADRHWIASVSSPPVPASGASA